VALDAIGLFPRVTTWLGFRRDSVLRGYMADFITLFAPQLTPELVRRATECATQAEVDELFAAMKLPLRSGCNQIQLPA
jgi:LysR family cys regulon transcriptional activator